MPVITNKRSVMTLYSGGSHVHSHRVRIVLAEKVVSHEIKLIDGDPKNKPEALLELNPYATIPTLVDRELVLYDPNIIMEYLDERFPHPPLMPVYPVARAKARLIIYRFDRELGPLIKNIESDNVDEAQLAVKELGIYLLHLLPIFQSSPYFLGDEFSLVDCCLAPVLWRLPMWGVNFSSTDAKILNKYKQRLFQRDSFQASLTEEERELRKMDNTETA